MEPIAVPPRQTFADAPVDILAEIFLRIDCHKQRRRLTPVDTLLSVSTVNRHWRQVCIENPRLWCFISQLESKRLRTYLAYSENAPLDVYYNINQGGANNYLPPLRAVMLQLHRIKSLKLLVHHSFLPEMSLLLHQKPAPQLHHLEVITTEPNDTLNQSVNLLPLAPRLDYLEIRNTLPQSLTTELNFSCMRSLTLDFFEIGSRIPFQSFLSLISGLQSLESLFIDAIILPSSLATFTRPNQIPMPHLQTLHMGEPISIMTTFLELVELPKISSLSLSTVNYGVTHAAEVNTLIAAIHRHDVFSHDHFGSEPRSFLPILDPNWDKCFLHLRPEKTPSFCLSLPYYTQSTRAEIFQLASIQDLIISMRADQVTLHSMLICNGDMADMLARAILSLCYATMHTIIFVSNTWIINLFSLLKNGDRTSLLKFLANVRKMVFKHSKLTDDDIGLIKAQLPSLSLEELSVQNSTDVQQHHLDELRTVVPNVTWDGVQGDPSGFF